MAGFDFDEEGHFKVQDPLLLATTFLNGLVVLPGPGVLVMLEWYTDGRVQLIDPEGSEPGIVLVPDKLEGK